MKTEVLINAQIAFFFKHRSTYPDKLWLELSQELLDIFENATPLIIPLPDQDNTSEIPVVQVTSSNGVYRLVIARSRADLYIAGEGSQTYDDVKDNALEFGTILFDFFKNSQGIDRIALIVRNFVEEEKSAHVISTKLIKSDLTSLLSGEPFDSFVRYTTHAEFQGLKINNYTTFERNSVKIGQNPEIAGVLITRDFNTVPEVFLNDNLNRDSYRNFIVEAGKNLSDLKEIKNLLWLQ